MFNQKNEHAVLETLKNGGQMTVVELYHTLGENVFLEVKNVLSLFEAMRDCCRRGLVESTGYGAFRVTRLGAFFVKR